MVSVQSVGVLPTNSAEVNRERLQAAIDKMSPVVKDLKGSASGSEIIVENSGAPFEPADDGEPHIALGNIRQRLEMMCRGQMTITPREGGGTVVKVTIP